MVLPGRSVHRSVKIQIQNLRRQYKFTRIGPQHLPLPEFLRKIISLTPLDMVSSKADALTSMDRFRVPLDSVVVLEDAILALQGFVDQLAVLGKASSSSFHIVIPIGRKTSSTILTELAGRGAGSTGGTLAWCWEVLTERVLTAARFVEARLDLRTSRSRSFARKFHLLCFFSTNSYSALRTPRDLKSPESRALIRDATHWLTARQRAVLACSSPTLSQRRLGSSSRSTSSHLGDAPREPDTTEVSARSQCTQHPSTFARRRLLGLSDTESQSAYVNSSRSATDTSCHAKHSVPALQLPQVAVVASSILRTLVRAPAPKSRMGGSCASASPPSETGAALPSCSSGAFARREFSERSIGRLHDGSVLACTSHSHPVLLYGNNNTALLHSRIGNLVSPACNSSASRSPSPQETALRVLSREGPSRWSPDHASQLSQPPGSATESIPASLLAADSVEELQRVHHETGSRVVGSRMYATLVALEQASV
ncbi:hypothetical protein C8R47DRAFT_1244422 [Mycena vitilis]|nr:hypothetical protein C8R47DRAFT_1244422 [Mycena vitilis]